MQLTPEIDNEIMKTLKVSQLRKPLGWTDKGEFSLLIRKGEKKYTFMLDAIPVESDQSKKLCKIFGLDKTLVN